MPALHDPVPASWQRRLRRAVLEHAQSERRRRHPPLLHAGTPGGPQQILPALDPADLALRTDLVAAAHARVRGPGGEMLVWLTRSGPLELQDVDALWLAAALAAAAESGGDLTFVVANRSAWRDPRTGVGVTWKRLRQR